MKKTMLDYVHETPEVLQQSLARSAALTAPLVALLCARKPRILRIVASGSSRNAAACARPMLRRLLGVEVLITPPHTFAHYEHELPEDELTVVVSQSGYSTNALQALDVMRAAGKQTVGITGDLNSDMRTRCDVLVEYGVGEETVGYVTKGVSALVLFFELLALEGGKALGRVDAAEEAAVRAALAGAAAGNRACAEAAPAFLQRHYRELSSMQTVFLCGGGPGNGVAMEGALKLCETLQIPAVAYETDEYIHGPELQLTPNHTVFFVDGGGAASPRVQALWKATCTVTQRAYLLTCAPDYPDDDRVFALASPGSEEASALCFLPLFQTISYQLTEDEHLWHKHPLCRVFENTISGKSENYVPKEVM